RGVDRLRRPGRHRSAGRRKGQPRGESREADGEVVVDVVVVEDGREAVVLRSILDSHRGAVQWLRHRQVLVENLAGGMQDDLEGVRAASAQVQYSVELDDHPGTVVVVVRVRAGCKEQIVPERGDEILRRERAGQGLIPEVRGGAGEGQATVGADTEPREIDAVETEGESDGNEPRNLIVPRYGNGDADRRDVHPMERGPAGRVAVDPVVAEIVGATRSQRHRVSNARVHLPFGERWVG